MGLATEILNILQKCGCVLGGSSQNGLSFGMGGTGLDPAKGCTGRPEPSVSTPSEMPASLGFVQRTARSLRGRRAADIVAATANCLGKCAV